MSDEQPRRRRPERVVRLDIDHGWPEPPISKFDPVRMFYAARRLVMRAARRPKTR